MERDVKRWLTANRDRLKPDQAPETISVLRGTRGADCGGGSR